MVVIVLVMIISFFLGMVDIGLSSLIRVDSYNNCKERDKWLSKWYIVHVYSGFENKVKTALEERIATSPNPKNSARWSFPPKQVVELVKGKREESSRKFYPGYILVQMDWTTKPGTSSTTPPR